MRYTGQMSKTNNILSLIGSIVVACVAMVGWIFWQLQPVNSAQPEDVELVIAPGTGVARIAEQLQEAGLVRSALVFRAVVRLENMDGKLQAGSYSLTTGMTPTELVSALSLGRDDSNRITILEGWRREEIAAYLESRDLVNVNADEFLELTAGKEGMLFPDTYLIPEQITTEQIVALLTNTFDEKVMRSLEDQIENSTMTTNEIVTLASIVEREARGYEDRRHVAGILLNRLRIGMALQADATMQYARGYDPTTQSWWSPPRPEHKSIQSPYNTYQQPGLPPGPICSPSLSSIQAVLDPNPSDDLFYIHTSSGDVYYAKTYEEHNANIRRYLR